MQKKIKKSNVAFSRYFPKTRILSQIWPIDPNYQNQKFSKKFRFSNFSSFTVL